MGKNVTVRGFEVVQARLENIKAFNGSELLMEELGRALVERVLLRTSRGIDVSGAPFIPYSAMWKEVREDVGLQTAVVDLFFSGSMFGALTYESSNRETRVFFMDTPGTSQGYKDKKQANVSNAKKAVRNQELRDFFGMSAADVSVLTDIARDWVKALVGEDLSG